MKWIVALISPCSIVVLYACMLYPNNEKMPTRGIVQDIVHMNPLLNPVKDLIKNELTASTHNPYRYVTAYVRQGKSPLADDEVFWRKRRFAKIKKAQEKFLHMQLADDEVLDVALSCSGGGFRAMLGTLGGLAIAEQSGLLDCIMTVAGLSGSTWLLGPWITYGIPLREYKEYIVPRLSRGLMPENPTTIRDIAERLLVKFAYEQPLSTVDLYGTLLANTLLMPAGKHAQNVYLYSTIGEHAWSHVDRIAQADYPFPVYTAVLGDMDQQQEWFEFTPFEVGCRDFETYVPSWAFGRQFKNGESIDDAPEQSLGYVLGVCGSAFGFNLELAYDAVLKNMVNIPFLKQILENILYSELGKIRLAYAEMHNFMYGLPNIPVRKRKCIKMVDAGVDFCNPVFATYRKPPYGGAPDVLIMLDHSDLDAIGFVGLSKVASYAKRKGFKFPTIDNNGAECRALTVFDDNDSLSPLVIYMPLIKDLILLDKYAKDSTLGHYCSMLRGVDWKKEVTSGYAHLVNMIYTEQQARMVCGLSEFNMLTQIETIREIMRNKVVAKRNRS